MSKDVIQSFYMFDAASYGKLWVYGRMRDKR